MIAYAPLVQYAVDVEDNDFAALVDAVVNLSTLLGPAQGGGGYVQQACALLDAVSQEGDSGIGVGGLQADKGLQLFFYGTSDGFERGAVVSLDEVLLVCSFSFCFHNVAYY